MKFADSPLRQGFLIAAVYSVVGSVWIASSDRLVEFWADSEQLLTQIQTIKGWAFVGVSAVLILLLSSRAIARERSIATSLRQSEAALQRALTEKEVLLAEINHRVRNNLQLVVCLLTLGSAKLRDADARRALDEALARVHAIGLVHHHLYETGDISRIEFGDYARDLCRSLARGAAAEHIRIDFELERFECDPGYVIPLGMILVELVGNSIKHAFPERQAGAIMVRLHRHCGNRIILEVSDDGVGFEGEPPPSTPSGLALVQMMTEQLRGELSRPATPRGTMFRVDIGCEDCPTGDLCPDKPRDQTAETALRS